MGEMLNTKIGPKFRLALRRTTALLAVASVLLSGCASGPIFATGPLCQQERSCPPQDIVRPDVAGRTSIQTDAYRGVVCEQSLLKEDQLISLALQNNATFRSTLAQLGMAEGDLVQSQMLTNPNLSTFFRVGVKQWEWTLFVPIEAFLLRPHRVSAAHGEHQRVANNLVQSGLSLVRDVRVAHTDFALAAEQYRLAEEGLKLRNEVDSLTRKRLESGDIGELEATQSRIDALNARANLALLKTNVEVARNRIHTLIGIPQNRIPIDAALHPPSYSIGVPPSQLISDALATRPDMRAASWAVEAASNRSHLARRQFWRIDGAIDANENGAKGYEVGPGIRLDLPIFNRNEGGIMRADSELEQARYARKVIHDTIVEEIKTATTQLQQSNESVTILSSEVIPPLEESIQIAQRGYEDGGAGYLLVLQTTSNYLQARSQLLDQTAALRRAMAELERSVARPLGTNWQACRQKMFVPPTTPPPAPVVPVNSPPARPTASPVRPVTFEHYPNDPSARDRTSRFDNWMF